MTLQLVKNMTTEEKMLAVCKMIQDHSELFDMASWGDVDLLKDVAEGNEGSLLEREMDCGTPGCFAGWTVAMFGNRDERDDFACSEGGDDTEVEVAAAILGLPKRRLRDRIFLSEGWCDPFRTIYEWLDGYDPEDDGKEVERLCRRAMAEVTALRVKFYVATKFTDKEKAFDPALIGGEFASAFALLETARAIKPATMAKLADTSPKYLKRFTEDAQ